MGVITTHALTKRYGRSHVAALSDLTVEVGEGVTGLVGANGAGKSTLIKILLGLLAPTSGTAQVLGHDIGRDGEQIRAVVGYMPEHDCLPPDMRCIDFVVHMGRMSGLPPAAARERAADVLRHVGLAEERYRLMGGYSTGMKQRAKLAQALVHDPQLIMLDEPTNGLDPAARDDMLALVHRIGHDFGIPVLVTSHLLGELERISDYVVVLDGGHLLRSQATQSFMSDTGVVLVEVIGAAADDSDMRAQARMGEALAAHGLTCRPRGSLIEIDPIGPSGPEGPPDPEVAAAAHDRLRDLVRDTAADLGVGLVRIQPQTGHLEDVFREEVAS
ncbi:MAG: ATP-binding cassette domain-containing protein [Ornithinimicrobium sp.]|uniref:ATP-binding cassette domain-containing protein n=1 Tax=Ornithinimicrobium sp. TaxID=1977084 RepID=UPI0026DF0A23|nr:ATP-binding cassette domain-containing protein [Ornithinimicrobium sp.]MDO5739434.1 ATP-binding cassette domain-containing protein [Ornithinimicrobium sp.]